ncbi:IS1 family transposase [Candidatus Bandiella woodruffii]|uniref:IS1 family transposase n=1 Tax=Candidatus Bandiella euplotis TaxID=1664265 RepID=A0ABZ0UMJ9_9RICK|nr:IS1 family transposase [Candidatus Bandiella woodruffii]
MVQTSLNQTITFILILSFNAPRIARMTRKTKVVSKSEEVVDLTIKLWLHFEDNNNFLSEQGNFISIFG